MASVDDRAIVAALVAGDQRGLEGAYRAYADRLFTYCRGLLRDPDAAADALHDTFVIASQRAGQLREPDRLRPWLYAIARNECLRLLRGRARQVPLAEVAEMSAPEEDPVAGLRAGEVQELVRAAAASLNPGDREVLELSLRHELPAPEVSALLGVSTAHAHARLSRTRAQLERAIGALLVARTGTEQCPALAGLLRGWDGELTALIRKRVNRHIEACEVCTEQQRRQVRPAALFSAYAAAPWLAAPADLWPRLQLTSMDPDLAGLRGSLRERAGRFQTDGFPRPWDLVRRRRRVSAASGAAVVLLLIAGGLAPLVGNGTPEPAALPTAAAQAPPAASPSAAPAAPTPAATASTATTPPSPLPPPPPPPPPPPTGPATGGPTATVGPLTVQTESSVDCVERQLLLVVVGTASEPLQRAQLTVWDGSTPPRHYPMQVDGASATGRAGPLSGQPLAWAVTVTAVDGRTTETAPVQQPLPTCSR